MAINVRPFLVLSSDGAVDPDDHVATRPFHVWDVHGMVRTQGGAGNVTNVSREPAAGGGFVALSSNLASDGAVGTLVRTTSLAAATVDFVVGDTLRINDSGTGLLRMCIKIIPRLITGD